MRTEIIEQLQELIEQYRNEDEFIHGVTIGDYYITYKEETDKNDLHKTVVVSHVCESFYEPNTDNIVHKIMKTIPELSKLFNFNVEWDVWFIEKYSNRGEAIVFKNTKNRLRLINE